MEEEFSEGTGSASIRGANTTTTPVCIIQSVEGVVICSARTQNADGNDMGNHTSIEGMGNLGYIK